MDVKILKNETDREFENFEFYIKEVSKLNSWIKLTPRSERKIHEIEALVQTLLLLLGSCYKLTSLLLFRNIKD